MNTLKAERRDLAEKAKKLRREGFVTGNVFGHQIQGSIPVKMNRPEVEKLLVLARRLNLSLDRLLDNEAAGKLSEDLLVLSPNKANLLSCRGGVKVDGCTIEVMSNKEGWITLCWYKTGKEAMDAMQRIREAMLQGKAYLEL